MASRGWSSGASLTPAAWLATSFPKPPSRPTRGRRLPWRSAGTRADGRDLLHRALARTGPLGRHGGDGGGHRVGGLLVVDPPSDEVWPGLLGITFDREVDFSHPFHSLEELVVAEADPGRRVRLLEDVQAPRPTHPVEAPDPPPHAPPAPHP